jgi:hypothetical protein
MQEVAELLQVPLRSAEREWEYARNWLHGELTRTRRDG